MSEHYIAPVSLYVKVFLLLLFGTGLTVFVADHDLGYVVNNVIAMGIAISKALLVLVFFMDLRHAKKMTTVTAIAGFFWLCLMIGMIGMDFWSRGASVLPVPGK
jgi:cytochrome c oxidase subunit 4